jgi:hypothetical protein
LADNNLRDYEAHRVFARDAVSLVVRSCVERNSDGHFAVAYIERLPTEGDADVHLEDLGTSWMELNFTTEDAAVWDFRPTLQEAIAAHTAAFAHYDDWIVRAEN